MPYFWYEETRQLKDDLKNYAKFMCIHLYPKNLLRDIDECNALAIKLHEDVEKIRKIAKDLEITNESILWGFLGINSTFGYSSNINPNDPNYPVYREKSAMILKDNKGLIDEIKALSSEIKTIERTITLKLESFMKANALRLEEETGHYLLRYW